MLPAYRKDINRTIAKNLKRFFAIATICALGVTMFCGLKAACADLRASADSFFDAQDLFDIRVLSTLGLTDEDVEALAALDGVDEALGGFVESTYISVEGERSSVDVYALPSNGMNEPYLLEGRLPANGSEVCVTQAFVDECGLGVGDTVELMDAEDADEEVFARHPYTIVGVAIDAMNVNNPGLTFRSSSSADYTFIVSEQAVISEIYTVVYLRVEGALALACYSDEYQECIDRVIDRIEDSIRADREAARTESIKADAQAELDDGWETYWSERADAEAELSDGYSQLVDAQAEIDAGWEEVYAGEAELASGEEELEAAWETYDELLASLDEVESGIAEIEEGIEAIDESLPSIESSLALIDAMIAQQFPEIPDESDDRYATYQQLVAQRAQLVATQQALVEQRAQLEAMLEELQSTQAMLEAAIDTMTSSLADAQAEIDAARVQLVDARAELLEAEAELRDGWNEWYEGRAEADSEFADAEEELNEGQADIDAIKTASWYVQDRTSLSSYSAIKSDAESIEAIGTLFPVVFLIVAILVVLTTITRLVEEERSLIGTYKALGYRNGEIYCKYIIYALAACVTGSIGGLVCGYVLLPLFLFTVFAIMYLLPSYPILYDAWYASLGVAFFLVGIVGTAFVACRSEVRQAPAELMRPKAPKSGSRIILERITPLWRRLSFLNKVTARNLFRYKRRFFMTVSGILGCTALIVCALIINDSVDVLVPEQYDNITSYDIMAIASEDDIDDVAADLAVDTRVEKVAQLHIDSGTIKTDNGDASVTILVVPDGVDLSAYLLLQDVDTGERLACDDEGIIITQNASEVLGFSAGAVFELQTSNLDSAEVRVNAIARNYLGNYVYMSQAAYERAFGESAAENGLLINFADGASSNTTVGDNATDENSITTGVNASLGDELQDDSRLLSVSITNEIADGFEESLAIINSVVVVVLTMAAALAFAVLFTLSTTNISEREREIATIKVLGFRPNEVHHYVNKETIILTCIGIVCGLPAGYVLGDFILQTLKMPQISFLTTIEPTSYVIAAILPLVFALTVNLITNVTLNRIDMIEALKSVE